MDSEVYFGHRSKHKTLDSPSDDFFAIDVDMTSEYEEKHGKSPGKDGNDGVRRSKSFDSSNVQDTTRVDTSDSYDFYYKPDGSNSKSHSSLSQQFLSNFLFEFTDEELAAKRTVETIYTASGSFAYTYRSLHEAFFAQATNFNRLIPFVKALVSVADECILLKALELSKKNEGPTEPPPADKSLLLNFELIMLGFFRPIKGKLNDFMTNNFPFTWKELSEFVTLLFKNGILMEFYTFFSNIYGIYEMYLDDFKRYLLDLKLYLTRLSEFLMDEEQKTKKAKRSSQYCLADCVDIVNFISAQLENVRKVFVLFVKNIMNTPETDNLEKVLGSMESDLVGQGLLKIEGNDVSDKVTVIRMLLDEDSLKFLGSQPSLDDTGFCRTKFNNFYTAYQEDLQRRSDESSEFQKKKKFKRDSVQYVLDRIAEMESNTLANNFKNPFYTVGIAPKLCNQDSLKKYSRKLKMLLHPDTEPDLEWKQKAEKAFKEASLSLDQCLNLVDTFTASLYRVGPEPPYLSHLGINMGSESGFYQTAKTHEERQTTTTQPTSGQKSTSEATFLCFPEYTIRCEDQKIGSLSVEIDLGKLSESKVWQNLGRNKVVTLVVLRPLHMEPMTDQVPADMISSSQKLVIAEPLKNKTPTLKVEAVQPILFGSPWKYFVGVRVTGERGSTLMSWKSVFIEMPTKGRSIGNIAKLLATFVNASFVSQSELQDKLYSNKPINSKADAERFLMDCMKRAQKWTDEN